MKKLIACSLVAAVLCLVSLTALALDQGDFIKPVDKKLKFVDKINISILLWPVSMHFRP